ncbi:hypothetical protein GCM10022251_44300 [Phytohabitans flavus]|uniref:Uncharacterized protein n=1 Tax=Phytohabitans flavus TaxID=1076124 RepID=A0A6F8XYH4_9ACTN|nr:hypothetical protein Pflav_052590 [Phytohabitans flavus]
MLPNKGCTLASCLVAAFGCLAVILAQADDFDGIYRRGQSHGMLPKRKRSGQKVKPKPVPCQRSAGPPVHVGHLLDIVEVLCRLTQNLQLEDSAAFIGDGRVCRPLRPSRQEKRYDGNYEPSRTDHQVDVVEPIFGNIDFGNGSQHVLRVSDGCTAEAARAPVDGDRPSDG